MSLGSARESSSGSTITSGSKFGNSKELRSSSIGRRRRGRGAGFAVAARGIRRFERGLQAIMLPHYRVGSKGLSRGPPGELPRLDRPSGRAPLGREKRLRLPGEAREQLRPTVFVEVDQLCVISLAVFEPRQ